MGKCVQDCLLLISEIYFEGSFIECTAQLKHDPQSSTHRIRVEGFWHLSSLYSLPLPGANSPGEPHQVPHPAGPAAAGEALPGQAWLPALPQPVLWPQGHGSGAGQQCPQQPYGLTHPQHQLWERGNAKCNMAIGAELQCSVCKFSVLFTPWYLPIFDYFYFKAMCIWVMNGSSTMELDNTYSLIRKCDFLLINP